MNLVVGSIQQFTAVDELGHPRMDATWTVDNTTVALITTDSQPLLAVLAAGQVTLTATVQGVSAQVKLTISGDTLAPGTPVWGIQPPSGYNSQGLFPAVPTANGGPGFYSLGTANSNPPVLQAYTADGQLLWQQPPIRIDGLPLPDAFGGVLVQTALDSAPVTSVLMDFDDQTGSLVWQYTAPSGFSIDPLNLAIRPDGAILAIEQEPNATTPLGDYYVPQEYLDVIDGNTGQLTSQIALPQSSAVVNALIGCQPVNFAVRFTSSAGSISVGADGTAYAEYLVLNQTFKATTDCETTTTTGVDDSTTFLLTISPGGSSSSQMLGSGTLRSFGTGPVGGCPTAPLECVLFSGGTYTRTDHVIPDGQGGALATWTQNPIGTTNSQPVMVTHILPTGGGAYTLPIANAPQLVLGENGTAFATDFHSLIAFDLNSGQVAWLYDNPISMIAATSGNGLSVQGQDQSGLMKIFRFDVNGVPTDQGPAPDQLVAADWFGDLYDANGLLTSTAVDWAASFWVTPLGSPSLNSWASDGPWFPQIPSCQDASLKPPLTCPGPKEAIYAALAALDSVLKNDCSLCKSFVLEKVSIDQSDFAKYLERGRFYDGTKSDALRCGALYEPPPIIGCLNDGKRVYRYFEQSEADAATLSPSTPMSTFFNPSSIRLANGGANVVNMAMIFHEALHGRRTHLTDEDIQKALGCQVQDDTRNITWYLEQFVGSNPPQQVQACTNYKGVL